MWNESSVLSFESNGNGVSKINSTGGEKIFVDKLDNLINDEISFIKMDIEGAEYKALEGCERIIKEKKPKLAICIYHKPEDILEIPSIILIINCICGIILPYGEKVYYMHYKK